MMTKKQLKKDVAEVESPVSSYGPAYGSTGVTSKNTPPRDAIKTVALYTPKDTARVLSANNKITETQPQLTYRGGPLLTNVKVFVIFWGDQWKIAPLNSEMEKINKFFDFIVSSPLIDQLEEYSVTGKQIGHGKLTGSAVISSPPVAISITDTALRKMLKDGIKNELLPKPKKNRLYFVYLPPNVAVKMGGGLSCHSFCGYHDHIEKEIFYAIMPYATCGGCLSDMTEFDALTCISTHELCEAITDPVPGEGWYDDRFGEIGDFPNFEHKKLGMYVVQLEWSNKNGKAIYAIDYKTELIKSKFKSL